MDPHGKARIAEFPFLATVVRPRNVRSIDVTCVDMAALVSQGDFYLFDSEGRMVGRTRMFWDESLHGALYRVGPENVAYRHHIR